MAAFAIVCTVLAFVAFAARSEFGCSVNDVELAWWSKRTWPPSHQKLPLVEIAKADMDDWGEEIQILLTTLDGQVLKIDGRFVGNGRDIFEAIVSRNQKIVATRNGKPIE